ncbi:alpha-ribazole phosphatase/probable phosphoglycerate mutase [Anseongella ginsenosidimutans]|uniref:Alpha-ribazole phosphatase/probable phosphoglycerate mutase n=1 Tax=Anseongella ginsenosidimutans TaxID=496056 RepID=A0A4R3KN99_9SPHI|nr:histidine phosphatase family protein [Anseongella ginsenosidimutans]QEC53756.1 histidine phosphatase family protein [Anseongella ginsenosidimutans]TCS85985.1 alpha-ribazole phosphatase/probable phosphoglycerate mutase [Anseongella ginsenosidimutans]
MLNVYLLRHGQTGWNADGNKYCGRTDIPLTPLGIEQAGRARALLEGIEFEKVYASPLERAHHTATIAGGGKPVETDERLIEVDFGSWEGKTRAEFILENAALWNSWCDDPSLTRAGGTGETALDVIRRVDAFFTEALKRHCFGLEEAAGSEPAPDKNILVVGHNGINRLYLAWKLGMHLKDYRRLVQENSTVTLFSLDEHAELTLKMLNSR